MDVECLFALVGFGRIEGRMEWIRWNDGGIWWDRLFCINCWVVCSVWVMVFFVGCEGWFSFELFGAMI